jgi:serine/threonine protein kinase
MEPERWDRVGSLFAGALEQPPGGRRAFVEQAAGDDPALGPEVISLLEAHEREDGLFASEPFDGEDDNLDDREPHPARIGPYQLFHLLGRGGMGSVYLASRVDGEYRKRVALKVLRPGFDSPDLARRFRRERQILASLDHPFIARLLDGGTIEEGRPFLVLEYVDGRPLDRWCREERPSLERRLDLFASICAAVAYAHQNLIVHRDLKPANILVTADGVPKLLDFGISKLLNPELSAGTLAPTALGLQPMTPDYASPEQLRGETITTASDVFSLGVLLFEMLTDLHPFREPGQTREQLLRRIREEEPTRPSDAVRRKTLPAERATILPRRLHGDLDAIVGKALRKEPHRRYGSVAQLAEDLERFREGAPVLARKGTSGYRFGKWVRRHRLAVAALSAIVAVSLGFARPRA